MTEKSTLVQGLTLEQWAASFRPGMQEFAASAVTFSVETEGQVRIAFANQGPYIDEHTRAPVYTHAVTLSPAIAVDLARLLIQHFARPADDPKLPVASV